MNIRESIPYTILIFVMLFSSIKMLNKIIKINPKDWPPNNRLPPDVAYPTGKAV